MSNEHTVKSYEEELQFLKDSLINMGSLTESQLTDSMDAIIKVDKDSIDKIIKSDEKINKFRSKIDSQIMNLLVKRAPMAIDLRETISSLKISQDLERIGDLSKSNAKKVKPLPLDLPLLEPLPFPPPLPLRSDNAIINADRSMKDVLCRAGVI